MEVSQLAKDIHENAKAHGWWEIERGIPELLCLVHSEVSEALEAYRKGDRDNFAEELADVVIRVFDMAVGFGIHIESCILQKHELNKERPYRHGGKKC